MMFDIAVTTCIPLAAGTYLAIEDPLTLDWFDRFGFAAVAVVLLYWVLKKFSAGMDKQATAIEQNTQAIRDLEKAIRESK
jgi:hypothetical protein